MSDLLTKADLWWIKKFLKNYKELVEDYPGLFSNDDIDDLKVVDQIIEERL